MSLQSILPSTNTLKSTLGMGAPSIPKSHKAAIFKEAGKPLVIEDVETQEPKAGEILVKVLACGVCRSDEITQHAAWGNPLPMIPGHEIVGDVVAVGSGDKQWKVGDRVGGGWHGGHDSASCSKLFPVFRQSFRGN